ncbi:hypothetical protein KIW84_023799 [Lathyrus oleraceus]|uniref:Transposase-associated domain-containing protein n=1 Tax=Pisum sativum TaxID=3888 RepID=A0A9D5A8P5_PEA|nr:hypothetical protein KIW84_062718 [Pisum sativum]KAI5398695.1 hypothetical protein KIW84_064175 [Pisum sativum]KAI5412764.1 hypothetical protein KIW84_057406 [Pisum sativum]KAI5423417.1 hypothetical protein KIW84_046392 [Pisum sativum]KAI5429734.1 hypothetical protein KIW84_034351 [Pisum sativum]
MYDRTYPGRRGLKPNFEEGVKGFITWAFAQECCLSEGGVRCPCLKCECRPIISDPEEVERHLKRRGFIKNYWVWTYNGEQLPSNVQRTTTTHASSSRSHMEHREEFSLISDMVGDAFGVNVTYDEPQDFDQEELPNEEAQKFYQLLQEMNTPLFEGSSDSKLSMCVRLLAAKSNWNVPDQCLEFFAKMMLDATPTKDNLPTSFYDAKRLVSKLGLEVRKIDCCTNGCMLFYDNEFGTNDGSLEECKFCKSPRYKVRSKAINRKTKDNEKARKDMEILCNRKELELKVKPNGKLLKPKANYSLTSEEAKAICRWLNELRMPDGYASNLARCADSSTGKLHGMKSHDCHVFMERLLPIAFSSLPKHVLNPLTEISQFFRDICASKLRVDDIVKLDKNIPVILFFGIPGRPSGKKNVHWLTQKELLAAHVHVLINCVEVKPYLEAFNTSYFQSTGEHPNTSDTHAYFPAWFKEQLSCAVAPTQEIIHLRNLSRGPVQSANEWHTYFVNGYKFHTKTWTEGKKTINSGVFVKGVTDGGEDDFYGTITHIYELVYNYLDCENKVVLFYCDWYDISARGTKIDKKYNTVEIRMDRRYKEYDPFIMSHIVRQVYYVPYPSTQPRKRGWCVVIKTKPLGHIEADDVVVEDVAYQDDETSQVNDVIEVEQITSLCDTVVEGHQVDASTLLTENDVDEECEEFVSEDSIRTDEDFE